MELSPTEQERRNERFKKKQLIHVILNLSQNMFFYIVGSVFAIILESLLT